MPCKQCIVWIAGSNPGHHFLQSYRRAFMGICQAQFTQREHPVRAPLFL